MAQDEKVEPGAGIMDIDQLSHGKDADPMKPELPAEEQLDVDCSCGRTPSERNAQNSRSGSVDGGIRLDDVDSEELPPPEMTPEQKQAMVDCVRRGDIEEFEELLDIPGADINMVWFSENLLMTAVRWKREEMALYLIDNGVEVLFETTRLQQSEDPNDSKKTVLRWYTVSCRQIAYDNGFQDVVDAIDLESGEILMHQPTERTKRFWKPKEVREFEKHRAAHEDLSDLSSLTAVDLLWEDEGAMADTEVTNSTVNSPRERSQTPSDKSASVRPEKGVAVDTGVVEVQHGQTRRRSPVRDWDIPFDAVNGESGEDKAGRKVSKDSFSNRPPKRLVEDEGENPMALRTVREEGQNEIDGLASADDDVLPCHSRGACTDDGVYGKQSPIITAAMVQNRIKSAGFARIGGTRTDMYRKRDSKRKLMLREQNKTCATEYMYTKPVMTNGSYLLESKRWTPEDGHKSNSPRECVTPISTRTRPSSPQISSGHLNEVFIKPKPALVNSSHPGNRYMKSHHNDSWDTFPSIGNKTTRLQHLQTYLIDVGGRKGWEKK